MREYDITWLSVYNDSSFVPRAPFGLFSASLDVKVHDSSKPDGINLSGCLQQPLDAGGEHAPALAVVIWLDGIAA
jgi:hypothetical protein